MNGTGVPNDEITLARKLAFLLRPAAYGGDVDRVEAVETHMSWVFLAGDYAYKLKKPVRLAYLDFSTVAARRHDCEEEVRLNRRLAAEVYLGTLALTRGPDGGLRLGGSGEVLDWLVKMRRLPEDGMLDRCIARGKVPEARLAALADLLARFYGLAPRVDWGPGVHAERTRRDVEADAAELLRAPCDLPPGRIDAILAAERAFLRHAAAWLDRRVAAGRVVEGHGDLRPEHVCLEPGPVVIDCLEFNREFRLLDAVDELAYLALECERLGAEEIGARILEAYSARSGDAPDPVLVSFYKTRRACLRAKIAVWHLAEPGPAGAAKWLGRAREYLDLAARHAEALR